MLIVPQLGTLRLRTEMGQLQVSSTLVVSSSTVGVGTLRLRSEMGLLQVSTHFLNPKP